MRIRINSKINFDKKDGYYINPELKKSSTVILCLMFIFLLAVFSVLKIQYTRLKKNYSEIIGSAAERVIDKHPELQEEVIPMVTKELSKEDRENGKKFLKQYGLSEDLDNELFPSLNIIITNNKYLIILLFGFMTMTFLLLNYFQYAFFYKRIRRLTIGAKEVIDGNYDIHIDEDKEGDLSKLAVSFNSMRGIIQNNLEELIKEKQFLIKLLSDISHQLKTPLSSLILHNDIMLSRDLSKEQMRTFLLKNQDQLYRMNWLIKNLLKLAKLDANAIQFVKENASINETIQDSIDAIYSKASDENIEITFKENQEIFFMHDRLWIEEALINIVKNAIEHTQKGGEINIELEENPAYIRISITDNGEGIREEDLPNIFKRFYKGKTSKKTDSVGIGLALSKSIIESHNGMIEVYSDLGKGTKFDITFLKY